MDIQTTKIELMKMILGIENPAIIEKISSLIKNHTSDFWDELSAEQKKNILKAKEELDAGKGTEWNEFKVSIS